MGDIFPPLSICLSLFLVREKYRLVENTYNHSSHGPSVFAFLKNNLLNVSKHLEIDQQHSRI